MHHQEAVDYRMTAGYGNPRLRMYTTATNAPQLQPSTVLIQRPNNYNVAQIPNKHVVGGGAGAVSGYNKKNNYQPRSTAPAPRRTAATVIPAVSMTTSIPNMINTYQPVPQIPVASAKKLHTEPQREPFVKKPPPSQQTPQQPYQTQQKITIKKRPVPQPAPQENGTDPTASDKTDVIPQISPDQDSKSKEKTPMCLVNELARYNKITHQYRLISESGPAHKKKFTVTLKVGEEEYTADGPSIKKAQHTAADQALKETKYPIPPAKSNRVLKAAKKTFGNVTPTVELNALAMKQGLNVEYIQKVNTSVPPPPLGNKQLSYPPPHMYGGPVFDLQNNENHPPNIENVKQPFYNKYAPPRERLHSVSLKVGYRTFEGTGITPQAARHNAASSALKVLKAAQQEEAIQELDDSNDSDLNDLKSPISLVHEIALKRKLTVTFEVKQEKGPPHMKSFVTICRVGDIVTEGEGNAKKISRKQAAAKMLEELKQLGPAPQSTDSNNSKLQKKKGQQPVKRKNRNLVKENIEQRSTEETNPISYLIQFQQSRKEKEPEYTLVEEKGAPRRREFLMEVSAGGLTATGSGPNKKTAKKNAALNLLTKMGITSDTLKLSAEAAKSKTKHNDGKDNAKSSKNSRQIVPGVLSLPSEQAAQVSGDDTETKKTILKRPESSKVSDTKKELPPAPSPPDVKPVKTTTVSTEKPQPQPSSVSTEPSSQSTTSSSIIVNPKQQLLYLAQILDFQVNFSDFPKGNHGEFLTLVTLSTNPPQLLHGSGNTMEESNDQAALKALSLLRELGLGIIKKPAEGGES